MATVPPLATALPSAEEWKDLLEEVGTYRRGDFADSALVAGFSVAVAAVLGAG